MSKNDTRYRGKPKPRGAIEVSDGDDPNWPNAQGRKDRSAKLIGAIVLVTIISVIGYFRYQQYLKDLIITPVDSPKIIHENSSLPSSDPARFWGSYRPHAYFGLKSRSKTSPVFGLMWMTQMASSMPPPIRHWCDQGDGLDSYIWKMHDGRNFGVQEIKEKDYTVVTEFVKRPGGDHGGDWTARVTFKPKDPTKRLIVTGYLYAALDGNNGLLDASLSKGRLNGLKGHHEDCGNFKLTFSSVKGGGQKENFLISYANQLDQLKDIVVKNLKVEPWDKGRTIPYLTLTGRRIPKNAPGPNFVVKEVTAQLPFTMEMAFESGSVDSRENELLGGVFNTSLLSEISNFDTKFEKTFGLKSRGYKEREVEFAKSVFSNMVGSIGYFYGSSLVQSKYNDEPVEYWKTPLYSGVPSRPFFPRGFLWDEGFHNLLISMWDEEISKDIIGHWMDLMNVQGWIPREQILGVEARAKVPSEFVVQRNTNANPPTFFLPLQRLIKNMISSGTPKDMQYLGALYPRLKTWFDYYNTSQTGKHPFTFRWHGRDPTVTKQLNPLTLASGLDDYPRASHPTEDERHVDLYCWIALASGVMADIARTLGKDANRYAIFHKLLIDNRRLDDLHWSPRGHQYSDYGLHTDKIRLEKPKPPSGASPGQRPQMDTTKIRVVQEEPSNKFVDALGYISLYPFLTKIIDPDSPKLNNIFTDLTDSKKLWTEFGIRSISRRSRFYGRFNSEHDPPYWRGNIWINMNYLCLSALHHYSSISGPYQENAKTIYQNLRKNLVNNLIKEYYRTGYIWENYNDITGEGKGTHPFTGWSALVVLIMAEKY